MISVSDILKILESIPVWRRLKDLPERVGKLEERIAMLERGLAAPKPAGPSCPLCGAPMRTAKVEKDPVMGEVGVQLHTLSCTACDHTEQRQIVPK